MQRELYQLYINLKQWKTTLNMFLVTCCHQDEMFPRTHKIFPRSIRSVWYHYLSLTYKKLPLPEMNVLSKKSINHV